MKFSIFICFGLKKSFGQLNQSIIVITFDLAQSDPIKRRALYQPNFNNQNIMQYSKCMYKCHVTNQF